MKTKGFLTLAAISIALAFTSSLAEESKNLPLGLKYGGKATGILSSLSLDTKELNDYWDFGMGWGVGVGGIASIEFNSMLGLAAEVNLIFREVFNKELERNLWNTTNGIVWGTTELALSEFIVSVPIMARVKPVSSLGLLVLAGVQLDLPLVSTVSFDIKGDDGNKYKNPEMPSGSTKGRSALDLGLVFGVGYQGLGIENIGADFRFTLGLTDFVSDTDTSFLNKSGIGQQYAISILYYL